jgi:hypothetical protein
MLTASLEVEQHPYPRSVSDVPRVIPWRFERSRTSADGYASTEGSEVVSSGAHTNARKTH